MTENLKNCPFCGGTANIAKGRIEFWAYCPHCGAQTELFETEQEVADAWNRRNETELHEKIGKLESENARLREALELIAKSNFYFARGEEDKQLRRVCEIAKDCLKEIEQ